jgi:methionyl-tRNA formyltransferase
MTSRLRIACFGLPLAPYLLARDGHDVRLAVLAPVAAPGSRRLAATIGRERVLRASELGAAWEEAVDAELVRERPELIVSWFWTRRLPQRLLARAPLGAIGAHPSLLPRHRGPNPYFHAIDAGDVETGVTIHRLTAEYDDGEMLAQRAIVIGERDAWQLARALDRPSLALLREVVAAFAQGDPPVGRKQAEEARTWAPEPDADELHVNWSWSNERVLRRMRALAPVPGIGVDIEGLPLVALKVRAARDYPAALEPGEAAVVGDPPALVIRTGDAAVAIEKASLEQPDGEPGPTLAGAALARAVRTHLTGSRGGQLSPALGSRSSVD